MADLMLELSDCVGQPRFELDVKSIVSKTSGAGVPILGKPDIFFINSHGAHVIMDWKCNGFTSKYRTSAAKGYVKCRPEGNCHKEAMIAKDKGITINMAVFLEQVKEDWAAQLSTYAWLCGEEVGSPTICGIEQLLNQDRVASHRCRVSKGFQEKVFQEFLEAWETIQSGWIFRDMTEEDSRGKQKLLDEPTVPDADFDSMIGRAR
jgi:hypothetical protein